METKICRKRTPAQTSFSAFQWTLLTVVILTVIAIHLYLAFTYIILEVNPKHIPLAEKCEPNHYQFTVDLVGNKKLENDSLQVGELIYPPKSFWTHNGSTRGCPCHFKTCIRKCCPQGQRFVSKYDLTCIDDKSPVFSDIINHTVFYRLHKGQSLKDLSPKMMKVKDFYLLDNFGCNEAGIFGHGSKFTILEEETFLITDGTILTKSLIYFDLTSYCLESTVGSDNTLTIRCAHKSMIEHATESIISNVILHLLLFVSVVCLVVSITVYAKLPELQNLNGKLLMCHMIAVIGYYFSIITLQISPEIGQFVFHTFLLARTTWLTASCFELFLTFCRPFQHNRALKGSDRQNFLLYSLFGWGLPALCTLLTVSVGVVPEYSDSCPGPRFQDETCVFTEKKTDLLFTKFPLYLLISVNIILFAFTLYKLRNYFNSRDSTNTSKFFESSKERIWLYIKLSLYMGINWFLMAIVFTKKFKILSIPILFWVAGIYNMSQGIIIFLLLIISNKRVLNLVCERWMAKGRVVPFQPTSNQLRVLSVTNTSDSAICPPTTSSSV